MTSTRMAHELAAILVPLGIGGAVVAVLCAVVAGVAIMRGAGGLAGGAVGLWIPAAVLSLTASFAAQWMPLLVAGAALVGMLVLGGVGRAIVAATQTGEPARPVAGAVTSAAASTVSTISTAPTSTAPTSTGGTRTASAPGTGTVPALAS